MLSDVMIKQEMCPRCGHTFNSLWHKGYCGSERTLEEELFPGVKVASYEGFGGAVALKQGIDVSHWQGNFDWDIAVKNGIKIGRINKTSISSYPSRTAPLRNTQRSAELTSEPRITHPPL